METSRLLDAVYRPILNTDDAHPKSIIEKSANWIQIVTSSLPVWYLNSVKHAALSNDEVDAAIARTIGSYKKHGLKSFTWIVGPRSRPENLDTILMSHGFVLDCTTIAMAVATEDFAPESRSGFRYEELSNDNFEDFMELQRDIWGMESTSFELLSREKQNILSNENCSMRTILCYKDDEVYGSGAYGVYENNSLHLIGGGVRKNRRGEGVYRALVEHRIDVARERGIPLVTVHCLENTSAPICRKFGFMEVCEFVKFKYTLPPE